MEEFAEVPNNLDAWIETLFTCKPLKESDIKLLCEQVWHVEPSAEMLFDYDMIVVLFEGYLIDYCIKVVAINDLTWIK